MREKVKSAGGIKLPDLYSGELGQRVRELVDRGLSDIEETERRMGRSFYEIVSSHPSMRGVYREIASLSGVQKHPSPVVLDIGGGGVLGDVIWDLRVEAGTGSYTYVLLDDSTRELEHARERFASGREFDVEVCMGDRLALGRFDGRPDFAFHILPTFNEQLQRIYAEQFRVYADMLERGHSSALRYQAGVLGNIQPLISREWDLLFFRSLVAVKTPGVVVWAQKKPMEEDKWVKDLSRLSQSFGFETICVGEVEIPDEAMRAFLEYHGTEKTNKIDVFAVRKSDSDRAKAEYAVNLQRDARRKFNLLQAIRARDGAVTLRQDKNTLLRQFENEIQS